MTTTPPLVPEGPRDATKLGECCQAMRVVLDRPKGEKFATVKGLFAWVRFCPFCGTPTEPQP